MEISEQLKELRRRRNSHYRTARKWLNEEKDILDLFIYAYKNSIGFDGLVSGNRKDIYEFLAKVIADLAKEERRSFNDVIASLIVAYHNNAAKNEDK